MKTLTPNEGFALLSVIAALSSWFVVLGAYIPSAAAAILWTAGMLVALRRFGLINRSESE